MIINLSETQEKAVRYKGDHLLINAGAGTGKTRVLTEKIRREIEYLPKGEKILVVTFSNKASDELLERIKSTISIQDIQDKLFVGTIHKFSLDILINRGHHIGLPNNLQICESEDDRLTIFKEALKLNQDFSKKYLNSKIENNDKKIKDLLNNLSSAKRNLKEPYDYNDMHTNSLYRDYDMLLLEQNMIDYDDILRYTYRILAENEVILDIYNDIYTKVYVDEAQDLNKAQYELIKLFIGQKGKSVLVGDPKQSIYTFTGSSSKYMLTDYINDFNPEVIELTENYRSAKKIIEQAKKINKKYNISGVVKYDGEFTINKFNNEVDEASYIINMIEELLKKGHDDIEGVIPRLENIAILGRTRFVFNSIISELNKKGIKYHTKYSNSNILESESDFVRVFELGLKLIVNPNNIIALNKINYILEDNFINFDELKTHLSNSNNKEDELLFKLWFDLSNNGDINLYRALDINKEINLTFPDENEQMIINNDFTEWLNKWEVFISKTIMGNRSLSSFLRSVSMGETAPEEKDSLVLSTVHMSKGDEYDVVFIVGLTDGVFPDYRAVNKYNNYNDKKDLDSELDNFFVAITRSKRLCYLTYPLVRSTPWGDRKQYKSRFIQMLDE